jgi:hypothetical protein
MTIVSAGQALVVATVWKDPSSGDLESGSIPTDTSGNPIEYLPEVFSISGVVDYGNIVVHSGGSVDQVSVFGGGSVTLYSGADLQNTSTNDQGSIEVRGGSANDTILNGSGGLVVYEGIANNTIVWSGCSFDILSPIEDAPD